MSIRPAATKPVKRYLISKKLFKNLPIGNGDERNEQLSLVAQTALDIVKRQVKEAFNRVDTLLASGNLFFSQDSKHVVEMLCEALNSVLLIENVISLDNFPGADNNREVYNQIIFEINQKAGKLKETLPWLSSQPNFQDACQQLDSLFNNYKGTQPSILSRQRAFGI